MSWLEVLLQGRLKIACNRSNMIKHSRKFSSFPGVRNWRSIVAVFLSFVKVLAYSLFSMRREWLSIFDSIHFSTAIQIPDTLLSPRKRHVERVACLCVCACSVSEMEAFTNQRQVTQQACWCDRPHRSTLAPAASWIL